MFVCKHTYILDEEHVMSMSSLDEALSWSWAVVVSGNAFPATT